MNSQFHHREPRCQGQLIEMEAARLPTLCSLHSCRCLWPESGFRGLWVAGGRKGAQAPRVPREVP